MNNSVVNLLAGQIKDGEEKKPILCMRACTSHYRPYCGTDGRTYSNKCFLDLAKCKNKDLKEKHSGPCSKFAILKISTSRLLL